MTTHHLVRKGFTLVEMLVVVAVISLLTSATLASVESVKLKNRNAKRVSDMQQVSIALNLYYNENGLYPVGSCLSSPWWNCWGSPGQLANPATPNRLLPQAHIQAMPQDPLFLDAGSACSTRDGSRAYSYYSDDGKRYILATNIENLSASDPHAYNDSHGCTAFANWAIKQGF